MSSLRRRLIVAWAVAWLLPIPASAAGDAPSGGSAKPGVAQRTGPASLTQPNAAASAESASGQGIQARPKVELQFGSGDFTSFQDTIVVDGTTSVRLRWSPVLPGTAKARWTTRAFAIGPPSGARNAPSGAIPNAPAPGGWSFATIALFGGRGGVPPGPTRYELTLIAHDAADQPIGVPSNTVVIEYRPPGSGPPQQIQLDQVQLLDWSPKGGLMNGPSNDQYYQYGADQKVDLSFRIDLVTEDTARLSNNLIGQDGKALVGNFYTFVDLHAKGTHTESNFVTIRCDAGIGNPYYEQKAYGVEWKLFRKGSDAALSEGKKTWSTPLTWRCPGKDQLTLTATAPSAGVLRGITTPADASKPGRSVELHYQYRLGSEPKAVVKQIPLGPGYQPVQHEYWTETKVSQGSGTATNLLSVYCQSELQPDVEVKYLRYTLAKEGSGESILQEVVPTNLRFSCKPSQILPAAAQGAPALAPIRSQGGSASGDARLQKAPAGAPALRTSPAAKQPRSAKPSSAPKARPGSVPSAQEPAVSNEALRKAAPMR